MSSIFDTPPAEVLQELEALKIDLNHRIPFKRIDHNLLIATWNIRSFGNITRKWKSDDDDSPKRDLHAILCIAEIIRRFDVVAVQEVTSNLRALRDTLKILGDNWSLILTDVNRGDEGNGERMAYIFDTRRVNLSGLACELVVPNKWKKSDDFSLERQFVRAPYAVSFKSASKTFVLVTLHIDYGDNADDRIDELKGIAEWMADWATQTNAYNHNLIALGDLLDQTFLSKGLHVPDDLQKPEVTRSIFDETKYYDQIAWFDGDDGIPKLSLEYIKGGNYDFVGKTLLNRNITKRRFSFMMSDHLPLWAEFKV
jgi:endonuclease/exonuclease/phosphatase family metal-dependent hydrolase